MPRELARRYWRPFAVFVVVAVLVAGIVMVVSVVLSRNDELTSQARAVDRLSAEVVEFGDEAQAGRNRNFAAAVCLNYRIADALLEITLGEGVSEEINVSGPAYARLVVELSAMQPYVANACHAAQLGVEELPE